MDFFTTLPNMPLCFSAMSLIKVDDICGFHLMGPYINHHFFLNQPINFLPLNFGHSYGLFNPIIVSIVRCVIRTSTLGTLIIFTSTLFSSIIIIISLFTLIFGLVKSRTDIKHNYFYKRYKICNLFP